MDDAAATLRAAQAYILVETIRLESADPDQAPTTIPDLTAFPDASLDGDTILLTLDGDYSPRRFDVPMFFFIVAAVAFGGSYRLNSRERGKPQGRGRHYARLDIGGLNMSLMRIVKDAQMGEVVREHPVEFRNYMPEFLRKERVPVEFRPSKNNTTRADMVAAVLGRHEIAGEASLALISRTDFEALLWRLLTLADARAMERAERDAIASAPWATALR